MSRKPSQLKYKPKERVLPPATIPAVNGLIDINEAISLIAHHCKPKHENLRACRNKVSNTVTYAIDTGLLKPINGQVIFGEFMAWAKTKTRWQSGLATFPTLNVAYASLVMPTPSMTARAISLPTTLEDCHKALIEADSRIANLEAHLEAAQTEIEVSRPLVALARKMKRPRRKR